MDSFCSFDGRLYFGLDEFWGEGIGGWLLGVWDEVDGVAGAGVVGGEGRGLGFVEGDRGGGLCVFAPAG